MKLCFLAASNSIHSYKWIKYFADCGHEGYWISAVSSSFDIPNNVKYFELNINTKFIDALSATYKVRKIVSEIQPDILHVHYVGIYALLGLFSGAKQIVSTPWGSDVIEGKKSIVKRWIVSRILHKSKMITCDAYHMRNEVMNFGIHSDRIRIINFGIDTERFSKQEKNKDLLDKFGISNELSIVSLRNFEPVYDIKTLIFAAKIVLKENSNVRFILLGRGTLEDELKALVRDLGIDGSVCFTGFVDNQLLPSLLSSMDIYVSTSLSDAGIASSTAEAMACETPVVISDSAENDKWVNNEDNGFLFSTKNHKRLAGILVKLLQDEALRKKVGKEGRNVIVQNNDYENEMNKVNNLYIELSKT